MSYGRRPTRNISPPGGGLPAWMIFVMAMALVFGGYYVWIGTQEFLRTGGLGFDLATEQASFNQTGTAVHTTPRATLANVFGITLEPTATELPPCSDFVVIVSNAILRSDPTTRGNVLTTLKEGDTVCVVGRQENTTWYIVDTNPFTRRLEAGYMRDDLIRPLNPTETPTLTLSPPPTVTEAPTLTPSITPTPTRTYTPDLKLTPTATDTPTPTNTQAIQNA